MTEYILKEDAVRVCEDAIRYAKDTLVRVFEKRGRLRDGVLSSNVNIACHRLEDAATAIRALPPVVAEGWRPIATAPYSTEVIIRAGGMTFHAELVRDGAMSSLEEDCDQWRATREGEHPPCWSDGCCWDSNEDELTSLQPDAWRPASPERDG